MSTQPEQVLENNLLSQLTTLGYSPIVIKDEQDLLNNLRTQLEKHNRITISDKEFDKILNHLNKGNVFERAKILRDKVQYTKDNGDSAYIEFINQEHWCQNQFQVSHQVSMEGTYKNRYDVTLLVNPKLRNRNILKSKELNFNNVILNCLMLRNRSILKINNL